MLKRIVYLVCCVACLHWFISCGSDDTINIPLVDDELIIRAEVDENPVLDAAIAAVNSELTGALTYTLRSLSVEDAIEINSTTGALSVGNSLAFDYERRTEITGTVIASNGAESEEWDLQVVIRNIDDVEYWLSDSKTAYQLENSGNWVLITEAEYEQLATQLNSISKSGTTDLLYAQGSNSELFETYAGFTISNDLSSIPENSYVFAFKYLALGDAVNENQVKVSDGIVTEGYIDLGNMLPVHNQGQQYFVLKGARQSTTTSRGFLGIYAQNGVSYDSQGNAAGTHLFGAGDLIELSATNVLDRVCIYQGLSTPVQQWD
jgi:hypothetical protein